MAVEIFYSYSHKDETLREELEKRLSLLKWQGIITDWHDRRIVAGQEWIGEIDTHLNTADVILLLISPDFMASTYCYGIEVKHAMERHERGETRVIPIILRPVYWQGAPFGKLQPLPTDGKPVKSRYWHNLDEAFFNVAEGIRKVVQELSVHSLAETSETAPALSLQQANLGILPLSQAEIRAEQASTAGEWKAVYFNTSVLTVQQVKDAWENVRKRVKEKTKSGLLAAYLMHFKIIGIEGTVEQPIIIIQAEKEIAYKYVKAEDRYKDLEWALSTEFNRFCLVRLLPPNILPQPQVEIGVEQGSISKEGDNIPTLSVQQVKDAWENVRRRTKQKSKSGLTAAYLGHYKVIGIEGTAERPTVVIQATKQVHYDYVKANDRYKSLEWALTTEFGQQCRVRLIPPE